MKTVGIMLNATDARPRTAGDEEKYRLLVPRLTACGWQVKTLSYHDTFHDHVRDEARQCAAVLTWINPTEPGLDRDALDGLLRELAAEGVLVSAHPDTIERLGTKDVLVATQSLHWSVETVAHHTSAEFRTRFPASVRRAGARVLKRHRGHSGQAVWKITALPNDRYEVRPAAPDAQPAVVNDEALFAFFDGQVFDHGAHLIDQCWVPTMDRGMVRAYLCGPAVAGFGYQEIVALHPSGPDDDFTRRQPSRRHYYTAECYLFRKLRTLLEREWLPRLLPLLRLSERELPLLWDADFFFGDAPGAEFLLCEINASCVSPFPDSAITPFIAELERRVGVSRNAGA